MLHYSTRGYAEDKVTDAPQTTGFIEYPDDRLTPDDEWID